MVRKRQILKVLLGGLAFGSIMHAVSLIFSIVTKENLNDQTFKALQLYGDKPSVIEDLSPSPVLVVAYQRTGSTFLAGILGNHPDAFLWFEPMDGIFCNLYGTAPGWTVPVDIYADKEGLTRLQPNHEHNAVVNTLSSILTCDFTSLPIEVMAHKFVFGFRQTSDQMMPFINCSAEAGISAVATKNCFDKHLKNICPYRFGTDFKASERCRQFLHNDTFLKEFGSEKDIININTFKTCLNNVTEALKGCVEKFSDICASKSVAIAKTVRARMTYVEDLMEKLPNLRVIHMYRDPRPVVPSRRGYGVMSIYGQKEKKSLWREAELYCRQLNEDIQLRRKLENKYPGKFLEIAFQDLAGDPVMYSNKLLKFLNLKEDVNLKKWITEHTGTQKANTGIIRNSTFVINKWKSKMDNRTVSQINKVCQNLYKTVGNIWPYIDL